MATKAGYYHLLQQVQDDGNWELWNLYILKGFEETAKQTLHLIEGVKEIMQQYKNCIRTELRNYVQYGIRLPMVTELKLTTAKSVITKNPCRFKAWIFCLPQARTKGNHFINFS